MRALYNTVCVLFSAVELSCVWDQYFNLYTSSNGIVATKFHAYHELSPEAIRMLEWYSLWVANNKCIMTGLLLCTIPVTQRSVRCASAWCMTLGCLMYYPRMAPLLTTLPNDFEFDLNSGISVFVITWMMTAISETLACVKETRYKLIPFIW